MFIDKKTYQVKEEKFIPYSKENFKKIIADFFKKLNTFSKDEELFLEYKTYIKQFRFNPSNSTIDIDNEFKKYLKQNQFNKKYCHKLKSFLKGENLKKFQLTLKKILKNKQKLSAKIRHLWEIALHITPKKLEKIINKLNLQVGHL